MRVLILGARGQLGRDCEALLRATHEVIATDLPEADVTRPESVGGWVQRVRPDVILNCAAYTHVDRAEQERQLAHAVNADGARIVAEIARLHRAFLIHISTDYVFDGARPPPLAYTERDVPAPINWYGRTKLAGEQAIREVAPRHAILRTAWLYGRHGRNFLKAILARALAEPGKPLWVVSDQYGCPTWSRRLAVQIAAIIEHQPEGLFHAAGECHATWYELAKLFLGRMGVEAIVEHCLLRDRPTPARRPANTILRNVRLAEIGLNRMRPWAEDLEEFIERHRADLLREARGEAA
ncbi:MAG: dTDP-4-dehydrorhamnose reductase [Kiritimatiellae bacterium]|nr:dTDP-4-dehydrorhamnose reductase [Kiritimatiellia bacterium]